MSEIKSQEQIRQERFYSHKNAALDLASLIESEIDNAIGAWSPPDDFEYSVNLPAQSNIDLQSNQTF
jgi:hypothetical protein